MVHEIDLVWSDYVTTEHPIEDTVIKADAESDAEEIVFDKSNQFVIMQCGNVT
jgi:hypothetical protein